MKAKALHKMEGLIFLCTPKLKFRVIFWRAKRNFAVQERKRSFVVRERKWNFVIRQNFHHNRNCGWHWGY